MAKNGLVVALLLMGLIVTWPAAGHAAADGAPLSGEFVGRVAGSDAFIAVVADGDGVIAYVCDGTEAGVTLWGWFRGSSVEGHAELTASNGHGLILDLTGDTPRGHVLRREGALLAFETERTAGDAGLWRGEAVVDDVQIVGGWVVLNDGEQRGAVTGLADGSVRFTTLRITDGTSNTVAFTGGVFLTAGKVVVNHEEQ